MKVTRGQLLQRVSGAVLRKQHGGGCRRGKPHPAEVWGVVTANF